MEPIIEFKNYSFKYNSQVEPTLRDIDLSVYPGEKILIIGPSGSGKSHLPTASMDWFLFLMQEKVPVSYILEERNRKTWAFLDYPRWSALFYRIQMDSLSD